VKFKLDENLGNHGEVLLAAAGHDVATVRSEGLGGATDEVLFAICQQEDRALITLDHDFGHVLRFPPENGPGVVILEPGPRPTPGHLRDRIRDLLALLDMHELKGSLWIVEPGRVRIRERRGDGQAPRC
jgi:predicted nuclease of predicted toxin-antitoxin system